MDGKLRVRKVVGVAPDDTIDASQGSHCIEPDAKIRVEHQSGDWVVLYPKTDVNSIHYCHNCHHHIIM